MDGPGDGPPGGVGSIPDTVAPLCTPVVTCPLPVLPLAQARTG